MTRCIFEFGTENQRYEGSANKMFEEIDLYFLDPTILRNDRAMPSIYVLNEVQCYN